MSYCAFNPGPEWCVRWSQKPCFYCQSQGPPPGRTAGFHVGCQLACCCLYPCLLFPGLPITSTDHHRTPSPLAESLISLQVDTELLSPNFPLSGFAEGPLLPAVVRWMMHFSLRGVVRCLLCLGDEVLAKGKLLQLLMKTATRSFPKIM